MGTTADDAVATRSGTGVALEPAQSDAELPVACNLMVFAPEERARHIALSEELLLAAAEETNEFPEGYAFRFPASRYEAVTEFIANERHCCPFFSFGLEVSPNDGPIWLRIGGGPAAKDVLSGLVKQ
jgi:hypothetical protein